MPRTQKALSKPRPKDLIRNAVAGLHKVKSNEKGLDMNRPHISRLCRLLTQGGLKTALTRLLKTGLLAVILMTPALTASGAQIVTNWAAYNDHRPGPLIPPHVPVRTNWGTARWVTTYDMGAPADTTGNLTNFLNGQQLPVTVTFTRTGLPDDFGTVSNFGTRTNSPAGEIFFGAVSLSNDGIVGVDSTDGAWVTITFNNLDPAKRFVFRGTAARANGYLPRWSVATINAPGWVEAHIVGAGSPGILTSNYPGANLLPGQAAWNSGDNVEGDVIGWDFISPAPDGSFSIVCAQYLGPVPGGVADSDYAYAFAAMLLAEVEVSAPVIVLSPPPQTTVEQNRAFSLSVIASGTPLLYQWYKEGVGAISGATSATYTHPTAALGDSGDYYAVVYNPLASVTSTVAHVTVNADVNPPAIATAFSYPSIDPATQNASLNQVIVEFNEAVDPATAGDALNYQVSGGVAVNSINLPNNRTAVLNLSSALAEDSDYTVQVSDVLDLVNNSIRVGGVTNPAPFRSWMQGPGNALVYEAYDVGPGTDVAVLTASPLFPDEPFYRTNLWAFDSRVAFADDSHNGYGSRTRGVFIPPASGDWVFYLRSGDRSQFFLNPNGLDAAGKQLLVAETTGADGDWNKLSSSPVTLRAGQAYYIEGLQKADGAVDYIKVAARLFGTGLPGLGVPNTAIDTNVLMGGQVCSPYAPRDLGGPLTILQQPEDLVEDATHFATFSIQVSSPSNLPVIYKWFRDGLEIPGAAGPSYSFRTVLADGGATFSVQAAKVGSVVTSRSAALTVHPDTTKPTVIAVHGSFQLDRVIVSFSELVDVSAEDKYNYAFLENLGVLSAVRDASGTNVILTLEAPFAVGSVHNMTIENVTDFAGNTMDSVTVSARAWVRSRGFAMEELFLGIGAGTTVPDLTGNAKYISNSPDVVAWVPTLEGPTSRYDNYGTRLSGWIAPPVAGDYLFYFCSDDGGQFSLSPDIDPAGVALIAQEMSYADARTWTGDRTDGTRGTPPSNISTNPVSMNPAQLYAFLALEKDGTGGDNTGVNWLVPGLPVPTNGSPGIAGAHLYSLADPVGASVTVTQQPVSVEAVLPATVTFSVGAASTFQGLPSTNITYVWQRDTGTGFTDIVGAYSRTYSANLTPAEAGSQFRVLVFSPGASATSLAAGIASPLRVSITQNGSLIRISWALPGTGVTLEKTTTLTGAPPPWTTVPSNTYQTDATSVFVEIPAPIGNAFYRLHQ